MAEAFWRADVVAKGDLRSYLDFRNDVVTSLITEIRSDVGADTNIAAGNITANQEHTQVKQRTVR